MNKKLNRRTEFFSDRLETVHVHEAILGLLLFSRVWMHNRRYNSPNPGQVNLN